MKLRHKDTHVKVDISFNMKAGVQSVRLIQVKLQIKYRGSVTTVSSVLHDS